MWHYHLRRAGGHAWRLLLALLVLVLLLAGALLAALGSETGSRWLLERGLGMQRVLEARYEGGTLLWGLDLADVHLQTAKTDLRVRRLLARWSLWELWRGEVTLSRLELDSVDLRRRAPPSPDKTDLPTLILPLRLHLLAGEARGVRYWNWGAASPHELRLLLLRDAEWVRTRVRFGRLLLDHEQIGRLDLAGRIRLRGGYPLEAQGRLDYLPFRAPGWGPVAVKLGGEVAHLDIGLALSGKVSASARGRLRPLEKSTPFSAHLQWGELALPWWSHHSIRSEGGWLAVTGNRQGLQGSLEAGLAARHLPTGSYELRGRTDWHSASVAALGFKGLGGSLRAQGEIDWRAGLRWSVTSRLTDIDLARKWPVPRLAVPILTGQFESSGKTSADGTDLKASLRLASGERWQVEQRAASWAWYLDRSQQLTASWAGVQRRLESGRTIVAESGSLQASGSRQSWTALLDTQLAGNQLPAGQWRTQLRGNDAALTLDRLDYEGEEGHLAFRGQVALAQPLRWSGQLALDRFGSAWLLPEWPGHFSGTVTGQGNWGAGRREFRLAEVRLQGDLRGRPLALDGPLDILLAAGAWPELHSEGLDLRWGGNQAVLTGGLRQDTWNLAGQLDLADLALIQPGLQGRIHGQVSLAGPERRPDVVARLAGEGLARGGLGVKAVRLEADLPALGEQAGQLLVVADGVTTSDNRDWGRLSLDVRGLRQDHVLDWRLEGEDVQGGGQLSGGLAAAGWTGRQLAGQVAGAGLDWRLAEPHALAWQQPERRLWLAPHCWRSEAASLCNEDEMHLGRSGHVRLSLAGLALERLRGVWPEGLTMAGQATGRVVGDWAPGEPPLLTAGLEARDGELRLQRDDGQAAVVRTYERIALHADAGLRKVDVGLTLASADMGQGQARMQVDPYAEGKPVAGEVSLDGLRLGVFQPFFPGLSTLAGSLSAQGRLAGSLARPVFNGQLRLSEGELAFQRLPLHVTALEAVVDVDGTRADIAGSMKSGEGGATLAGDADWSGEPRLALSLKGQRFQLSQPPELLAEVAPDLLLSVAPRRVDLTGSVFVPTGRLNFKRLTDQAIPLSPDIRVVHASDLEAVQVTGQVQDWAINADVRLRLGDDVFFQGYGVTGRLSGGLRLRQEGRRGLEASGEVELDKESRYDAYGQRLQIRRGRLIFAGNLTQPGLDMEAIRTVDDKVVGVRVEGRANAPEATLFSDTAMSQEEIVSYLVLGRPLDTQGRPDGGGNLTAAAAAIKLGATGAGGVGLTDRVGETLGISALSLDAEGNGDDTQFTVSGYLSPKLYLRYGVGIFTPVNTATLRYKINSRLYLEAVSSLENAIDIFYNLRF